MFAACTAVNQWALNVCSPLFCCLYGSELENIRRIETAVFLSCLYGSEQSRPGSVLLQRFCCLYGSERHAV
ncbi:hypothetical protein DMI65_14790 [Escherichia coli]|nr:hypothetical protein [Escherichia coli]